MANKKTHTATQKSEILSEISLIDETSLEELRKLYAAQNPAIMKWKKEVLEAFPKLFLDNYRRTHD